MSAYNTPEPELQPANADEQQAEHVPNPLQDGIFPELRAEYEQRRDQGYREARMQGAYSTPPISSSDEESGGWGTDTDDEGSEEEGEEIDQEEGEEINQEEDEEINQEDIEIPIQQVQFRTEAEEETARREAQAQARAQTEAEARFYPRTQIAGRNRARRHYYHQQAIVEAGIETLYSNDDFIHIFGIWHQGSIMVRFPPDLPHRIPLSELKVSWHGWELDLLVEAVEIAPGLTRDPLDWDMIASHFEGNSTWDKTASMCRNKYFLVSLQERLDARIYVFR